MSRRLLLLLLPAVAVVVVVALTAIGPDSPDRPLEDPSAPAPTPLSERAEVVDEVERELTPPEGGILVLDRQGRPAEAYVMSGDSEEVSLEDWDRLGETAASGILLPEDFEQEPRALLVAATRIGVGGPEAWDASGTVIRLGDGCVLSGFVRDPDGNPVAGAGIWGRRVRSPAFSGEDGAFRLTCLIPGQTYEIGVMAGGNGPPETSEVSFDRLGEEKHLDFEVPAPAGRRLLVAVRFEEPPRAQPVLMFDLGRKRPQSLKLVPVDSIVLCPAPLAAGQVVEVTVACPGFETASESVVMPDAEEEVRVTFTLTPGGLPTHGRVVDTEGEPVASAEVKGYERPSITADRRWSATTDRNGRFPLRAKAAGLHLMASIEAVGASHWLHLDPETTEVVLVLEDAGVVEGWVLDDRSGAPVEGATVCLSFELHGYAEWKVLSGPDGSYRFAGVPAGAFVWPWIASSPRADPVEPGPEAHFDAVVQSQTEAVEKGFAAVIESFGDVFRRDLPAVRHAGGNCRFVLKFPEGVNPASVGVSHASESERWHRTSGWDAELDPADPSVSIWLCKGTHSVHFRAGAHNGSVTCIEVTGDGELPPKIVTFGTGAKVMVQLVGKDGSPLEREGVRVRFAELVKRGGGHSGSGGGSAKTDTTGRADVTHLLPIGDELRTEGLSIIFTLDGEGLFSASPFGANANFSIPGAELADRIEAAAGDELVLPVTAWRFLRVPLATVDSEGKPVPGVRLICSPPDKFEESELVTDGNGVTSVGLRFEPDRWRSSNTIRAQLPWIGEIVDHPRSQLRSRDGGKLLIIEVRRARELTIRVMDQDGEPLRGASLGEGMFHRGETATTDENGRARLSVEEGDTEVYVRHSGFDDAWIKVPAGLSEVTHTMIRLRSVAIGVQAPPELAAEGALYARTAAGGRVKLVRGEDGRYRGEAEIPAGVATEFTVISPDRRWAATAAVGPTDDAVSLTLGPRKLMQTTLQIVDRDGKPLPGWTGSLDTDDCSADVRTYFPAEFTTDGQGRVHANLPPGRQTIRIVANGWRQDTHSESFDVPSEKEVVLKFWRR